MTLSLLHLSMGGGSTVQILVEAKLNSSLNPVGYTGLRKITDVKQHELNPPFREWLSTAHTPKLLGHFLFLERALAAWRVTGMLAKCFCGYYLCGDCAM